MCCGFSFYNPYVVMLVSISENENVDIQTGPGAAASPARAQGRGCTEDNESEDDVDFNPFLKESLSEQASSSLSSEVEGLDTDVVNSHGGNDMLGVSTHGLTKQPSDVVNGKKVSFLIPEQENEKVLDKEIGTISGIDVVEDAGEAEMRMGSSKNTSIIYSDDEDAICKRTRARYSLANCTLDELETFLQESDDEDDTQNVDEEEEYKKFLAAVLNGSNRDNQGNSEGNNDDEDDDEDNDADFEIEIEEALESDVDDCVVTQNKGERASRRPETRRKGCKKSNSQSKKRLTQQGKSLLRPLVPVMPAAPAPEASSQFPSFTHDLQSNGFQAHQIGQLHCLIYEHVQLLVQVHSLCVLETSRQHIASQIKGLLAELLHKRDLALAWRHELYPTSCFLPAYTCPSVSVEKQNNVLVEDSGVLPNDGQGRWLPAVGGSVLSVLDVAPLKLVGKYINDVSNAIQEHQRRCVETTNIYLDKQPLFPLSISSSVEVDCNVLKGDGSSLNTCEISPNNKVPKKTLAATIVESTKKQSVALVPPQIANLAQPFYPLFNPALFPHKPPSPSVANRVLFMDSEDVLLAMGMMEYNNDWKAIQQRFLPCKSEHQIFVRAKNRCSSKAPDNPIKAVRKMKTSPLTEEEKARIHEGLKVFKLDWTSVWRTMVPYRDPNLLPRQWRTAIGTQKSYKADSAKREKHRIYESNRRKNKAAAAVDYFQTRSEKENGSGEDCMDNDNEAYVHEAFLADWRPTSGLITSKMSAASTDLAVVRSSDIPNREAYHGIQESEAYRGYLHKVSAAVDTHNIHNNSSHRQTTSRYPPPIATSKPFGGSLFRSQRAGKPRASNLVKLAPELPPVKLPAAVRVISQASLRSSQVGTSNDVGAAGPGLEKTLHDPSVFECSANSVNPMKDNSKLSNPDFTSLPSQKDECLKNGAITDRGAELNPQMHPLLFRTMEEGQFSHYRTNNSMSIPTFSFFPPTQHQLNVNLLQNPCALGTDIGFKSFSSIERSPTSSSLDFHPLLQRAKESDANSFDAGLTGSLLNTDLELSRDQFVEDAVYDAGATAAEIADATRPTSPNVDAINLDLDIHLSSASKRRKVSNHEEIEINPTIPLVSGTRANDYVTEKSFIHCQLSQAEFWPLDLVMGNTGVSSPDESATVSHALDGRNGAYVNDNVGYHYPLLDIVMEKEELSDSDEELENVVFEREEISDSDSEEESGTDQVVNMHKEDQSGTALGTNSPTALSRSFASGACEGTRAQTRGKTAMSGLAGTGTGTGTVPSKDSWLSLNSHREPLSRTMKTEISSDLGGALSSPPNRSRRKAYSSSKDVIK